MKKNVLVLGAISLGSSNDEMEGWPSKMLEDLRARGHRVWPVLSAGVADDGWTVLADDSKAGLASLVDEHRITHCLAFGTDSAGLLARMPASVARLLAVGDEVDPTADGITAQLECADLVLTSGDEMAARLRAAGVTAVVLGHPLPFAPEERRFTGLERLGYAGGAGEDDLAALKTFLPAFDDFATGFEEPLSFTVTGAAARHFLSRQDFLFDNVIYDPEGDPFDEIDLAVALAPSGALPALSRGMPVIATEASWNDLVALPGHHDLADAGAVLSHVDRLLSEGFDTLTRLSNFSKASFAEYVLNRNRTLEALLAEPRETLAEWGRTHPGFLGRHQAENPDFVQLEAADAMPKAAARPVIAHLVNPVRMAKTSDLYIAQPVAYRAMQRAKAATTAAEVCLVARRYPEDADYMEDCFDLDLPLSRSARDLEIVPEARKLPLLEEVFSLEDLPDHVTHVVYTNSDIGVQPHFYDFVADRISEGHDALVINRRTVSKRFADPAELTRLYAEDGAAHPGFDCFVVSREVLARCQFADTLIGVHLIGRVVFLNLLARAARIAYFDDLRLTFHIGDDVPSKGREGLPYIRHNLTQGAAVARALRVDPGYLVQDPARVERFARVLHVLPGEIQGRPFDPDTDPHHRVQMHSLFRTGSTYLFQKLRAREGWTTYYEPFHEELSRFSPEKLDQARAEHRPEKFHHKGEKESDWMFAEFEALLKSGCKGVQGYDRRMSYVMDFENGDEAVRAYLDLLADRAPSENVFYQFNRTALRQDRMRALFPGDTHLYLRRALRDIWGSYLSFATGGVYGFLRNNLTVLSYNPEHPLARALSEHVPLAPARFDNFFHSSINEIFNHYTLEQHFLIHATLWHGAEMQAARSADAVIDLGAMSEDRLLRLETEATLAAYGVPLTFADVQVKTYDAADLRLSPARLEKLEELARGIVALAERAEPGAAPEADTSISWVFANQEDRRHRRSWAELDKRLRDTEVSAPEVVEGKIDAREMERSGVLALGFHPSERHHVWAEDSHVMLRFALPRIADANVWLRIHSYPGMVERFQETQIFINGKWRGEYRLGAEWERHSFHVSSADAEAAGGIIEIGFVIPHPFSGGRIGSRGLSLCLSELEVEMAPSRKTKKKKQRTAPSETDRKNQKEDVVDC